MYKIVKDGWELSSRDYAGTDKFWERSALGLSLLYDFKKVLIPKYVHGKLLDAGAGKLSYRHLVKPYITKYRSLDFRQTHPELDYVGDVQKIPLPDNSFDTVLCAEVLEHVPEPLQALKEIRRVLKPNGYLVMSTPLLMYLHNEPHDFYRYTNHGLAHLLKQAGFTIESIEPSGAFFSFVQGTIATTLIGLTYRIPLLSQLVFICNKITGMIAIWLDNLIDRKKVFALHFITVAQKPNG